MSDRYVGKRSVLPPSYINFIEANNGWEGDLGEKLGYANLWKKETIQERWDDCEMTSYLSDRWLSRADKLREEPPLREDLVDQNGSDRIDLLVRLEVEIIVGDRSLHAGGLVGLAGGRPSRRCRASTDRSISNMFTRGLVAMKDRNGP